MNYLLSERAAQFLRRLMHDAGVVVCARTDRQERKIYDVPPSSTSGCWATRWNGQNLEVRVPAGAVSLPGYSVHLTPAAAGGWYVVEGMGTLATTAGTFSVWAHVKSRTKLGISASIVPAVTVTAAASSPSQADMAGDILTFEISRCTVTATTAEGVTTYARTVRAVHRGPIMNLQAPTPGQLELYWASSDVGAAFVPHVPATGSAPICGGTIEDTALPATGAASVFFSIDCSGDSPVPGIATAASTSDAVLTVKIYELTDGRLTADERAELAVKVFYP